MQSDIQTITTNLSQSTSHGTIDVIEDQHISAATSEEDIERNRFNRDIHRFMAEVGKALTKIPVMGYKELDLYALFKDVQSYGGYAEVVKHVGTWSRIWKRLPNFDASITDSSYRLRKNYERYLLEYEYYCFPERRKLAHDTVDRPAMKKSSSSNNMLSRPSSPDSSGDNNIETTNSADSDWENYSSPKKTRKTNSQKARNTLTSIKATTKSLIVDDLVIEELGQIFPSSDFVSRKHIYPVGFRSSRTYNSIKNPLVRVKYTSQIKEHNGRPLFIVTPSDEPELNFIGNSPSEAWGIVLKKFLPKEDQFRKISVNGALRFGISHPTVSQMILNLPNAELCQSIQAQMSPSRKRKSDSSILDGHDDGRSKVPKSEENTDVSSSDEMDFESAVAALHSLKYVAIF